MSGDSLGKYLDRFGRAHPRIMLLWVITLALLLTLILLGNPTETPILYKAF